LAFIPFSLALVFVGVISAQAATFAVPPTSQIGSQSPSAIATRPANVLYSLSGSVAKLTPISGSNRDFRFTLGRPDANVVWFTDRPLRDSGTLPLATFVKNWTKSGFAADPPNVVIALHKDRARSVVAEMQRPSIDKATGALTARMHVLSAAEARTIRGNLATTALRHDATPEVKLGGVSVFIDDASSLTSGANGISFPAQVATTSAASVVVTAGNPLMLASGPSGSPASYIFGVVTIQPGAQIQLIGPAASLNFAAMEPGLSGCSVATFASPAPSAIFTENMSGCNLNWSRTSTSPIVIAAPAGGEPIILSMVVFSVAG